jgi:hypothetical protein
MNTTIKASRYLFNDFKKGMLIYYSIIAAVILIMMYAFAQVSPETRAEIQFSGFGFSTFIFMFVSGLNIFKINFKFLMANNIPRNRFYKATMITLVFASAVMAVIDAVLSRLLKQIIPYDGLVEQIYGSQLFMSDFMLSFTIFLMAASAGWFFTMLYYRSNKIMKTVICIAPASLFMILVFVSKMTGGALAVAIIRFLTAALGFNTMNPLVAAGSFAIASVIALALSYLTLRRMTIKD